MDLDAVLERFADQTTVPVMARVALEHAVSDELLDQLFEQTAEDQYQGELLFSSVVRLMTLVACKVRPSVNAAYQKDRENIEVSIKSVYNKLQGLEPEVARVLIGDTSTRLAGIISQWTIDRPVPFPGYQTRIVDGNHLEASDHRIKELRSVGAGPLPGLSLAVLDPATRLIVDFIPCEDGHAQERSLLPEVLDTVSEGQVWIADRNFCTSGFVWQISHLKAFFAVRQHQTNVRWEPECEERLVGEIETGLVYEQAILIHDDFGNTMRARRVKVLLKEVTRDGDNFIAVLTNLPSEVPAEQVARGYRDRWRIETAFAEIKRCLNGEINGLGYPRAALFSFAMALFSFNLLSVLLAAMESVHGVEKIEEEFSTHHVAEEIQSMWGGMMICLPPEFWRERYGGVDCRQLAEELRKLAERVSLQRYKKVKRKKKSPKPKRTSSKDQPHVSTARILNQARRNQD